MLKKQIKLTFLGVRGSYNISSDATHKYGGNTSAVQIETEEHVIFIDAGSGITKVEQGFGDKAIHLLFSHYHWDHIIGLPFFSGLYQTNKPIDIRGFKPIQYSLEGIVRLMFDPPFCPITYQTVSQKLNFEELEMEGAFDIDDIHVKHIPLMHPGGALGYRIEYRGVSICVLTDVELSNAFPSYEQDFQYLSSFIKDADIVIMDAAMTEDEYLGKEGVKKVGWGHSTIQECVKVVTDAHVKQTYITHYLPQRDDFANDSLLKALNRDYPNIHFAEEDAVILFEV